LENYDSVPKHIGFIMDGNGRWAASRGMPRNYGHQKGADAIYDVVEGCVDAGVQVISLFAFSTENWSRPKQEVTKIFDLLGKFLKKYRKTLIDKKIKFISSGDMSVLPKSLNDEINETVRVTEVFERNVLNIAINYGSRAEICRAFNLLAASGKKEVSEKDISDALYTGGLPDVDLIVRTSGEQRISNFLLYQSAYSELYFTDVFWPDFNKTELNKALLWYSARQRRFGNITDGQ